MLFQFASFTVHRIPGKTRITPKKRVITPSVNVRSPCNSVIVNQMPGGFEETPGSDADPPQHSKFNVNHSTVHCETGCNYIPSWQ